MNPGILRSGSATPIRPISRPSGSKLQHDTLAGIRHKHVLRRHRNGRDHGLVAQVGPLLDRLPGVPEHRHVSATAHVDAFRSPLWAILHGQASRSLLQRDRSRATGHPGGTAAPRGRRPRRSSRPPRPSAREVPATSCRTAPARRNRSVPARMFTCSSRSNWNRCETAALRSPHVSIRVSA